MATDLELVALLDEWMCEAHCESTCDSYTGPRCPACVVCTAKYLVDKLTESGRLLPPGGEEQYRIVWSGQEGTYVDGEIDDLQDGLDHLAIIRGLSFVKEAHLERRILTDWSPVVSDNSEVPDGD